MDKKELSTSALRYMRLTNQEILTPHFKSVRELLMHIGPIQGQDYYGAKWSVALRLPGFTDAQIEKAIADKEIVRGWLMRGTLHFAAATDLRWVTKLTADSILRKLERRHRELGLDKNILLKSIKILERELKDGVLLTRDDLRNIFNKARIDTNEQRLSHILYYAGLNLLVCFGTKKGNQFTYVLLDEWIPENKSLSTEEAMKKHALRYFTVRGPATLTDFVWWSGLKITEARQALEMIQSKLVSETFNGINYWMKETRSDIAKDKKAYLLPGFDEFLIAYKDRSAVLDPKYYKRLNSGGGMLNPTIILDGRVAGTWKRTIKKDAVLISISAFNKFSKTDKKLISETAEKYGRYLGLNVKLEEIPGEGN